MRKEFKKDSAWEIKGNGVTTQFTITENITVEGVNASLTMIPVKVIGNDEIVSIPAIFFDIATAIEFTGEK